MPFNPLPDESSQAFAGFVTYRDLGPDRALAKAYRLAYHKPDDVPGPIPGHWGNWSVKYRWVERARKYDAHLQAEKQRIRLQQVAELEWRRLDFEVEEQALIERRSQRIESLLNKADSAPITDVIRKENRDGGLQASITVKGVNLSGYAALVKQRNQTAAQAITGVRPSVTQKLESVPPPAFDERRMAALAKLNDAELDELERLTRKAYEPPDENGLYSPPV